METETNNMLALFESYMLPSAEEAAMKIADDFRKRRIEKGITREEMARKSGVALGNLARFEQKGLISLKILIEIARALGYFGEIHNLFSQPKYATMEELLQIRDNMDKKKAYKKRKPQK